MAPPTAAAATYLAELVCGPERTGEVLAVRSGAALAVIGAGPGAQVVALASTPDATRTANTVVLTTASTTAPATAWRPTVGTPVRIGAGVLQLDGVQHRVVRFWPSGVRAQPVDQDAVNQLVDLIATATTGTDAAHVLPLLDALSTTPDAHSSSGLAAAARALVGLGAGSTPAGDDALAGVALALRIAGRRSELAQLSEAIRPDLHDRTTALSADLLRAALAGHVSTEVRSLVLSLRPGVRDTARRQAIEAVLCLGHTSGADLLLGLTGTLHSLSARSSQSRKVTT